MVPSSQDLKFKKFDLNAILLKSKLQQIEEAVNVKFLQMIQPATEGALNPHSKLLCARYFDLKFFCYGLGTDGYSVIFHDIVNTLHLKRLIPSYATVKKMLIFIW